MRGPVLPDGADLKQVAVAGAERLGRSAFSSEVAPKTYATATPGEVGIDAGLAHLLTLSDGTRVEHQRIARKAQKRIRRLKRERDRRRRGGVNRRRTVARLGRAHARARPLQSNHRTAAISTGTKRRGRPPKNGHIHPGA